MEPTGEIAQEMVIEHLPRKQGVSAAGVGAIIGGIIGWTAGHFYASNKLLPFEAEVAKRTRDDIMSRTSAGVSSMGTGMMDPSISGSALQSAHSLELIRSGDHPFARFVHNAGGKGIFGLIGGTIGAMVGGAIGFAFKGKQQEELPQRIVISPAQAARVTDVRPQETLQHQEQESDQWRNRDAKQRESGAGVSPKRKSVNWRGLRGRAFKRKDYK